MNRRPMLKIRNCPITRCILYASHLVRNGARNTPGSVKGETRTQRFASSEELWKWIDAHQTELGVLRRRP